MLVNVTAGLWNAHSALGLLLAEAGPKVTGDEEIHALMGWADGRMLRLQPGSGNRRARPGRAVTCETPCIRYGGSWSVYVDPHYPLGLPPEPKPRGKLPEGKALPERIRRYAYDLWSAHSKQPGVQLEILREYWALCPYWQVATRFEFAPAELRLQEMKDLLRYAKTEGNTVTFTLPELMRFAAHGKPDAFFTLTGDHSVVQAVRDIKSVQEDWLQRIRMAG